MEIQISKPIIENSKEITNLFSTVICHTFKKENLFNPLELQKELKFQILNYRNCLKENDNFFLIAKMDDKIVGTISCGEQNEIIQENTDIDESIFEIRSVYVLPEYHGNGIGSKMFKEVISILKESKIKQYCLDSGYGSAQKFWTKKLGEPIKIIEDKWGKNSHHMIWLFEI